MSLRTRLLVGLIGAFLVFLIAAIFTVTAQRNELLDQVDAQLLGTPLTGQAVDDAGTGGGGPRPPIQSFSKLFLARVAPNGDLTVVVEGQLLADQPDVQELLNQQLADRSLHTVAGQEGLTTFRVLYAPARQAGVPASIVALPLDDVEATSRQLMYIFGGLALLMALALGLVGYWVNRFGIAPITNMTATAEDIAAGNRERRAEQYGADTEAGRLSGAFNVMLDERDQAENRLRRFVSDASHELRTPLTSIRGYLDLYAEGGFRQPGQLDDAIRRMQGESARMNLLVEDLLLLAKMDEDQGLVLGPVDLSTMLDDIVASALVARPDRSIDVFLDPADPIEIQADSLRLQQAIAVLVDNSLIHTPPGTEVVLSAERCQPGVAISVSDRGPGIAAEDIDRVFDRFHRADGSRSRNSGGSGLGLAIAKAVAEAHGGTISVSSVPGQGATFTLTIPTNPHPT